MMTIENANSTDHDIDGSDVLGSLDITSIKQRSSANAAWVSGMMGGHRFEALVFIGLGEASSEFVEPLTC